MSGSCDALRTWYKRDQFPSPFGAYKNLGTIVVPALLDVLKELGLQKRFTEFDFILCYDSRESREETNQFQLVLVFDLDGAFKFACRLYSPSIGLPSTCSSIPFEGIKWFSDVDSVRMPYDALWTDLVPAL